LRRVRSRDLLDTAESLVLQASDELAPATFHDRAVEPAFLGHSLARLLDGAARRPGHRAHVKCLDSDHVEPPREVGAGFLDPVLSPIPLAGAVVLTAFPTAIPSAVGITVTRPDYLLVYLVAAAELAVAVLSFGAIRITDWAALRLIMTTLVVLHLASGILDIVYMALTEPNATMISNTVLRFAVVAVFLVVWWLAARRHQTPGTSR
jgi:hypothetical protein